MQFSLDHLIIRSATPEATLAALAARAGTPILAPVERVRGTASGIVRAGPIDIEVLHVGSEPPRAPHGYGVGLVAEGAFDEAVAHLRALGIGTSPAPRVSVGDRPNRRAWRAAQLHGLLPDPFPAPASTRRTGFADRLMEAAVGALGRVPAVMRAATRHAGGSMVVLTAYEFDVDAWRSRVAAGPSVVAVDIGTGGRRAAWEQLRLGDGVRVRLHDDGPAGFRRVVLGGARPSFALGDVQFEFAARAVPESLA